jgi:predicted SnoaL-like aldol condensation-catalyzing enzyme
MTSPLCYQFLTKPIKMKSVSFFSLITLVFVFCSCNANKNSTSETSQTKPITKMELSNKEKAVALIESLETGAKEPAGYINPTKYIQHNLGVGDGLEGFGAVLANAPEEGFKAKVVRAFADGDYAVLHTEYDFFGPKAGFDVFRFEDGKIVEHWDNLAEITPPNPSGRTQLDGATEITDLAQTEANKILVKNFVDDVLINGKGDKIVEYVNPEKYLQHNSAIADGLDGLGAALKYFAENNLLLQYDKVHKVLGEGNFVLTMSEGKFGKGDHVAYYDLFRIEAGKIVEHWDIIQNIPVESEWKNQNGKF